MSFAEFAIICTYLVISILSQAKLGLSFSLVFLIQMDEHDQGHLAGLQK